MAVSEKITGVFEGKVVRKDLTKAIKGNAVVPSYVLEYLLGQYCASFDEEVIKEGVEKVKRIIRDNFVNRDEAEVIKSMVREKGRHKIIDKVAARLNEKKDIYEATFANLGIRQVPISSSIIKNHPKLLTSGVWCIITLGYEANDDNKSPWFIDSLKPIQISHINIEEYKEVRRQFSTEEWMDLLMQSIGLNPEQFNFRSKLLQLSRLIPFCENNYNLIELGPKGTGKSHIFSELSPHGILISGSEVTQAKLFVNNANGQIGLVGFWDTVAFDEFGGTGKKSEKGLVDIMKNYMANKTFSRGTNVYNASASMAFVGNTQHSLPYMMRKTNLFDALPKQYYDTAFLDRIHAYLPGWEVQKLRTEMFTRDYGFIVDYLAEVLRELRKDDFSDVAARFFTLSDSLTTRDRDAIVKTFNGLAKIIYPDKQLDEQQAAQLFDFAVELRKRVKNQLIAMDDTFEEVRFSYTRHGANQENSINTLEELTYLEDKGNKEEQPQEAAEDSINDKTVPEKPSSGPTSQQGLPAYKQIPIYENQTGISYKKLFAAYLKGATEIEIADPYIRKYYQIRNFMEFCTLIAEIKEQGQEVTIKLITDNDEEYKQASREKLDEVRDSMESLGIYLEYTFDNIQHDRYIKLNNGWKINMGRGLDIFQGPYSFNDIATLYQEKRQCRSCEITYLWEGNESIENN